MDVAVEILDVYLHPIQDWEDTILFYIERTSLTITNLLVRYTLCILLTPLLYFITTVIIEVYLQCFIESVSLRDIGKPTWRAEISSPSSLYLKAVKGVHLGSASTGENPPPVMPTPHTQRPPVPSPRYGPTITLLRPQQPFPRPPAYDRPISTDRYPCTNPSHRRRPWAANHEIYPVRSSTIQASQSPARHTASTSRGPKPSSSRGRGNPFAPSQGITHRSHGPIFRFYELTNPLGFNTLQRIPSDLQLECLQFPNNHRFTKRFWHRSSSSPLQIAWMNTLIPSLLETLPPTGFIRSITPSIYNSASYIPHRWMSTTPPIKLIEWRCFTQSTTTYLCNITFTEPIQSSTCIRVYRTLTPN